jgi:PEP-CTERM motif
MCKKQLLALTCLIVLALPVSEAGAATFSYDVDIVRPVNFPGFTGPSPDFVQGTITTDCNNCVMVQSDIVDWDLIIATHAGPSGTLLGPLSGNNSFVSLGGSNQMVATPLGLFFNFTQGNLSFNGIVDPVSGISPGTLQFFQASNGAFIIGWGANGGSAFINPTSDQIGTPSAVPEPSTWAMMLIGFCGLSFACFRQSRRKVSFA